MVSWLKGFTVVVQKWFKFTNHLHNFGSDVKSCVWQPSCLPRTFVSTKGSKQEVQNIL